MGNKFGLSHASAVEKTEFTLNDDDYVDVDFDIEDYVVLGKNFKENIDVENVIIVKEFVNDVINNAVNVNVVKEIIENKKEIEENIIANKLVDDIISNVVTEMSTNKKKKKKKRKNN